MDAPVPDSNHVRPPRWTLLADLAGAILLIVSLVAYLNTDHHLVAQLVIVLPLVAVGVALILLATRRRLRESPKT